MLSAEKRLRLVEAAKRVLHEQGFHRTTLADVAEKASIPLGNVYYYFKTKEALAEAVIASHETALRERFSEWEAAHRDPTERLRSLVRGTLDAGDSIVQFGCPHGSLCQELEKLGPDAPLAKASTRLLGVYMDWSEEQFRALGCEERSRSLATALVAQLQGTMLVAHTMRSRELLAEQIALVERWLASAVPTTPRAGVRRLRGHKNRAAATRRPSTRKK